MPLNCVNAMTKGAVLAFLVLALAALLIVPSGPAQAAQRCNPWGPETRGVMVTQKVLRFSWSSGWYYDYIRKCVPIRRTW